MVQVQDGDLALPFAAPMLARVLAVTGLEQGRALVVAGQVGSLLQRRGVDVVGLADVREATAQVLADHGELETLRRLRVRWWVRAERRPVVLAVGGASGVGKSTVSRAAAQVLGIDAVLSTDLVRAVLRGTLHPDLVPALSGSSFSAQRMLRSNLAGNPLLAAFEEQATLVAQATVPMMRRALKEGMQVVINGVHLVPGLLAVPADWPVFTCVLTVPDLTEHRRRFSARGSNSRDPERYLSRIDAIRELDEYIVTHAHRTGIPVVESRAFSQTVSDTVSTFCSLLDEAFGAASGA